MVKVCNLKIEKYEFENKKSSKKIKYIIFINRKKINNIDLIKLKIKFDYTIKKIKNFVVSKIFFNQNK